MHIRGGRKRCSHRTIVGSAPTHGFIILLGGTIMCDCKMEMTKQEMLDTTENFIGMEFMNVKMVLSDLQTL